MTTTRQRAALLSLAGFASLLAAPTALGQAPAEPNVPPPPAVRDSLPFRAGQWGAEFMIDDGTVGLGVLRFRSPRRAWMLDASFSAHWYEANSPYSLDGSGTSVFVGLQAGPRRYRPIAQEVATYFGFGLTGSYGWSGRDDDQGSQRWGAGVFGELGGVYFVTRRLSLGAQATVSADWFSTRYRSPSPPPSPPTVTWERRASLSLSPVRIVGALYF